MPTRCVCHVSTDVLLREEKGRDETCSPPRSAIGPCDVRPHPRSEAQALPIERKYLTHEGVHGRRPLLALPVVAALTVQADRERALRCVGQEGLQKSRAYVR